MKILLCVNTCCKNYITEYLCRIEKDALDEALEALDSQHQDEMNQLLTVRDDVKEQLKKVKSQLDAEMVSLPTKSEMY